MPDISPGWYADPEYPGYARWWNGLAWTDTRQPMPPGLAPHPPAEPPSTTPAQPRQLRWLVWTSIVVAAVLVIVGGTTLLVTAVTQALKESVAQQNVSEPPAYNPYMKGTSTSPPVPAPILTKLVLPVLLGSGHQVSRGGLLTQENDDFTVGTAAVSQQSGDAKCAPLTFATPVAGGTRDSVDPVEALPQYVSDDGTASATGAVQAFATAQDAINYLSQISGLVKSCAAGFFDAGATVTPTPATVSLAGADTVAWSENLQTPTGPSTVNIVDIRDGRFVARSYCGQSSVSPGSSAFCTAWNVAVAVSVSTAG